MVNDFFYYKTGLFATNMWSKDYFMETPCEYYLLDLYETVNKPE